MSFPKEPCEIAFASPGVLQERRARWSSLFEPAMRASSTARCHLVTTYAKWVCISRGTFPAVPESLVMQEYQPMAPRLRRPRSATVRPEVVRAILAGHLRVHTPRLTERRAHGKHLFDLAEIRSARAGVSSISRAPGRQECSYCALRTPDTRRFLGRVHRRERRPSKSVMRCR
jgi:hypothetical protein